MFLNQNIPFYKMQPVINLSVFDQLAFFVKEEFQTLFPRMQNPYIVWQIISLIPLEKVLVLRRVSRNHRRAIDWYMSLTSISYYLKSSDYHPKPEYIQRFKIKEGNMFKHTITTALCFAKSIKWVEFHGSSAIHQDYLSQFFDFTGQIEILSFHNYMTLGHKVFANAIKNNPQLRVIDLTNCQNLIKQSVSMLVEKAKEVEILFLDNCPWIDEQDLLELLSQLRKLSKLSLNNMPNIKTSSLQNLQKQFKSVWIDY